jgi:2,4-dienoyl-CoA reductase-like NADH-dependent reductase (Old Yellow Enzyme family)
MRWMPVKDASILSESVQVAGRTLRNRVVATAHGTAAVVDGMPLPSDVEYWARLARGGPAMVVAGGISVGRTSTLRGRFLGEAWHPHAAVAYRPKAQAITSGGALAIAQLCHLGRETLGAPTFLPFEAPSAVRSPREPSPARVLTTDDCAAVTASFVTSASMMIDAGFDGVEIHGAHGYLVAQFLNETINDRTDRYGGDLVGRCTLLLDIIDGIRSARPEAVVGLRLSVENDPDGSDLEVVAEVADIVRERAPTDFLDLTYGNRLSYVRDMATTRPPLMDDRFADRLRALRRSAAVPVVLCSAFHDRTDMEQVVLDGRADLVGMARPHIADPDVTLKLLDGRDDEVRPCVACNEDCRAFDPVGLCVVNPDLAPPGAATRPAEPLQVGAVRRGAGGVTVVGAGPAGLEAAVTLRLARPDLHVVLHERSSRIGGQLVAAEASGTRQGWRRLVHFYERELHRAGVELRLGDVVSDADADAGDVDGDVVWATGAEESEPGPRSGLEVSSSAFLLHPDMAPRRPLIVDDGFGWWPTVSAVEVALARGAESVTVVSPGTAWAAGIPADSRAQLTDRLRGCRFEVIALAAVDVDAAGGVRVTVNGSDLRRPVETDLLVRVGVRTSLALPGTSAWAIGDCVAPRRVSHAIAEGRAVGRRLALSHAPTHRVETTG